jgi:hypothetical protein
MSSVRKVLAGRCTFVALPLHALLLHFCCTFTSLTLHLPNAFVALLWDVAIASMETCSRKSVLDADTLICLAGRWEQELNILDNWWYLAQSKPHSSSSGLSICDCTQIFVYIVASYGNFQSRKVSQKITTWSKKSTTKERILWYIIQTTMQSTTSTGISDHIYDR